MPTDDPKYAPLSCFEIETLAPEFAEGLLQKKDRVRVEQHLATCPACTVAMEEMRVALSLIRDAEGIEVPRGLVNRILVETTGKMTWKQKLRLWVRPVLEPRLALGVAMALISFSLVLRSTGVDVNKMTLADLSPFRIAEQLNRKARVFAGRAVTYYSSLRVVYEIQTQLQAIRETAAPAETPKQQPAPADKDKKTPRQNKWSAQTVYLAGFVAGTK